MAQQQEQQRYRLPVPPVQTYKEHRDDPTTDFREWLEKFEIYVRIVEANMGPGQHLTNSVKNDYFCLHLGSAAMKTFRATPTAREMNREGAEQVTYQDLVAAAKTHFSPRVTPAKAHYDFHIRVQEPEETTEEYLTALRILAEDCEFENPVGGQMNWHLMLQMIAGCADRQTQQDLMTRRDLTLDKVIDTMAAAETAKRDCGAWHKGGDIHRMTDRRGRGRGGSYS